jgi:hypothetical protein
MRAEVLEPLREHMLAVIAANAFALRDTIGKSAFDERVTTAMGKVPRHEFVPIVNRRWGQLRLAPLCLTNAKIRIGISNASVRRSQCQLGATGATSVSGSLTIPRQKLAYDC